MGANLIYQHDKASERMLLSFLVKKEASEILKKAQETFNQHSYLLII
jgi:hypothetical protein